MSRSTMYPRITVITPSFNQAEYLRETIESVLSQRYENLEYIVIDGGSSDQSVDVIKAYASHLTYWVSEKDRGQSHAINKGLAMATGDIVAFLNSDDLYLPGTLHAVAEAFSKDRQIKWLAGGVLMFGSPDCVDDHAWWHRAQVATCAADWIFKNYEASQPAHFWRRELFTQVGFFDESYRFCFDHEFYVRLALAGARCRVINRPLAGYRFHGASKTVTAKAGFAAEFAAVEQRYVREVSPLSAWFARRKAARRERVDRMFSCFREAQDSALKGERRRAWSQFASGLVACPAAILSRAAAGCGRRILAAPANGRSFP